MKKILFVTGTRADYGKMKPLMRAVEQSEDFELNVFVSGMHLVETLGNTYKEVLKDGYKNIYIDFAQVKNISMSYNLGTIISNFTCYIQHIKPDMIVVHGDRSDALAGAIVGAMNNIRVTHVEGGEVSGTIDESIRHAISKFSHFHLVSNEDAADRLRQMGEDTSRIRVIGSPDIDIMYSPNLPDINEVLTRYEIPFNRYGILIYHPVTTELSLLPEHIRNVVNAVLESEKNYVVVYPNNDSGFEFILNEYNRFNGNKRFRIFPSLRFECFLTLLKHAEFMMGNSSAGIRETGIYGIPSIDIGTRQRNRYCIDNSNIQHVSETKEEILSSLTQISRYHRTLSTFGNGNSEKMFINFIEDDSVWKSGLQKHFVDADM